MKKLFYVALAALVLVSCGGDNKETKQDTTKKNSQTVQQDNNAKGGKTDESNEELGDSLKGSFEGNFEGNFEGSEENVDFDMDMSDGNIGMSTETEYGEVGYSVGEEGVNYNANVGGMDMGAGMDAEGNVNINMGGHSIDAGNALEDADNFGL